MDYLVLIENRILPLSFLLLVIFINLFLLYVIFKKKTNFSKSLIALVTFFSLIIVIGSILLILFTLFIGYNS